MPYFVIRSTEDGIDIRKTEGNVVSVVSGTESLTFLDYLPSIDKGQFWQVPEDAVIVIKGEIIVPKPRGKIVEYVFE